MATLTPATRYFNAGTTKVFFLPSVAAANLTPTRAEINAGTDLSGDIADVAGWVLTGGEIVTPDMASTFDSKIPGKKSVDDSSITFYADVAGADIRTLLPENTAGFIMIADGGDIAGRKADMFPVRVRSNGKTRSTGEEAARVVVPFSITKKPAENVTLPA